MAIYEWVKGKLNGFIEFEQGKIVNPVKNNR
jgi:hypothetical protein